MVVQTMPAEAEQSTRKRILAATFVVLSRSGHRNLQLSEVANEAGVSRPTLYRYFGSKQGLLDAFGLYEQDNFDAGLAAAMAGLRGPERLDAALQFIVDFQHEYSVTALVEIEPEHVLAQTKRLLPLLQERVSRIIPGEHADLAAAAVVRIAVSHFLLGAGDPDQYLAELRHAAGLPQRRRRAARSAATAS